MKKLIPVIIFVLALAVPESGISQTRKVTGTVVAFNQFPLKNITVRSRKAKTEVKTDEKGNFEIEVKKKDVLVIDEPVFVQFSKKIRETDNSLRISLIIKNDENSMRRVVEEGYISRENMEYGTKNLWHLNNEFSKFNDVYEAVKYAVPEAQLIMENGRRGFQLRGQKTLRGSNLALLVVNGVIVDDVSFVIPSDIIRISKLSSGQTALYGARGGNGVIKIETR